MSTASKEKEFCKACRGELDEKTSDKSFKLALLKTFRPKVTGQLIDEARKSQMHLSCLRGMNDEKAMAKTLEALNPKIQKTGGNSYYNVIYVKINEERRWEFWGDGKSEGQAVDVNRISGKMPSRMAKKARRLIMYSDFPADVSGELKKFKNLRRMRLYFPEQSLFDEIEKAAGNLKKLKSVMIEGNQPSSLQFDFGKLKKLRNLEHLALWYALGETLPASIAELRSLRSLDLFENYRLTSLPTSELRKLKRLDELTLSRETVKSFEGKGIDVSGSERDPFMGDFGVVFKGQALNRLLESLADIGM